MVKIIIIEFKNDISNKEYESIIKVLNDLYDKGINFKSLKTGSFSDFDGEE